VTKEYVHPRGGRHPYSQSEHFKPMDDAAAEAYDSLISGAIAEDVGRQDVTTNAVIDSDPMWSGRIVARQAGVVAGLAIAAHVFRTVDRRIVVTYLVQDGTRVAAGTALATVAGPARGLLTAERVALNLLGRLSGVATLTRRFVDAVGTLPARIADTRKTTPGFRSLERYAVRAGGGANHRLDLGSAVLIKDNHLAAVGSISEAVGRARAYVGQDDIVVEVECETLDQVREALSAGVDAVLLDNMDEETMLAAVVLAKGRAVVEASGGMTLQRIRAVAQTGVDVISVGALTHSAPALDVALDFDPLPAKPAA
jgi:nicotinate-nucleotide pyrophosphorylase (carboxylating)